MSSQTATIKTAPAYSIIQSLFSPWGYKAYGYAIVSASCFSGPIALNITLVSWDGTKVTMAGSFTAPCPGTLNEVQFFLQEASGAFTGYGDISGLGISMVSSQAYTLYLVETLSTPTTGTFQTQ